MASFLFYCPCKVAEIGFAVAGHGPKGDGFFPYLLWTWIREKTKQAKCRHCGEIVKMVGDDPALDRQHGITRKVIRQEYARYERECCSSDADKE
ncbi:MAG: hypothetical protein V3S55_09785, partial [Nitrospiraceae bacterium]